MSIRGQTRPDGSFIGFDYDQQAWIDTSPNAQRDATRKPGSASNPLAHKYDNSLVNIEVACYEDDEPFE